MLPYSAAAEPSSIAVDALDISAHTSKVSPTNPITISLIAQAPSTSDGAGGGTARA